MLLCAASLSAQDSPKFEVWLQRPLVQNDLAYWHQKSPLGRSNISDIAQDSTGYIWMTSAEGVLRFDGHDVEVYDRSNVKVFNRDQFRQVVLSPDDILWVSTNENLYYYKDREFFVWKDESNQLKNNIERLEFDAEGNLWALASGLLYRIEGNKSVKDPFEVGEVKSIIKCDQKLLWVVTEKEEVFTIDGTLSKTPLPFLNDLFPLGIQHVIGNKDKLIYVALEGGELYMVKDGLKSKVNWSQQPDHDVRGNVIHSLKADSQGFVWVLAHENLYRLNGVEVEIVNDSFGSSDFHVNTVFEDRHGDYWIGTYSGVALLYQSAVGFIDYFNEGEVALTTSVYEDREGNVWVGSVNKGLFSVKNHRLSPVLSNGDLPKSVNSIVQLQNGNLLIGGESGLFEVRYDGAKLSLVQKRSDKPIRALYVDRSGALWVNRQASEERFETAVSRDGEASVRMELDDKRVFFFYETNEYGLLIGTDAGLYQSKNGEFRVVGADFGLDRENFFSAAQVKESVWISSKSRGLVQLIGDSIAVLDSKKNFKIKNSSSMIPDDKGGLWFGVNLGVFYLPVNEFQDLIENGDLLSNIEFYAINSSDNALGYPLQIKTTSGKILITTDRGLIEVTPDFKPKRSPVLDIESYMVENEVFNIKDNQIQLSGNDNNLVINYSGIDFLNYGSLEYEFTLEGFDNQWHNVAQRSSAIYTNLPKGNYTFKLRLANMGNDSPVKTIMIRKLAKWYESTLFTILVGLLGFALLVILVKWRTRIIREKNKKLKVEVDLRTTELKQVLNSLEDTVEERTETLTKALEQLNLAMEAGKLASYYENYDEEGHITDYMYAEQFYNLAGYQAGDFELTREGWEALIHPEDAPRDQAQFAKISKPGTDNQYINNYWVEYRIKSKSGDYVWMESMGRVVERYPNGTIKKLVGVLADINDRKKNELARLESEERFRHVFEAGANGLILVNSEGSLELFNKRAAQIFNFELEEFQHKNISELIPIFENIDGKFDEELLKNQVEPGGHYSGCHKDGTRFPIRLEFTNLIIKEEELSLVVVMDMTHEMEMEQALEDSRLQIKLDRDKYHSVFENINDAIFIVGVEGDRFKYLEINSVDAKIIGYSKENVIDKYIEDLFPKMADYLNWRFASCRDSGEVVTYQEKVKFQDKEQDFETSLIPILEDGKVVRIIGIAHDITELIKSQKVIREREEKLRFALEATQDAIIDWDFQSGKVDVSPVLYRMLGYKISSVQEHIVGITKLINKSDFDFGTVDELRKQIQQLGDNTFVREFRMKMFDGSWLWVLMRGKVVKSESGDALRFVGTISDISKEKKKTKDKLEAILQTEDNERRRISREIHDGLQQTLTISALNLEFIHREISKLSDRSQKKFEQGWSYLQQAIAESRGVAHTLMPKAIVDFGFISACKSLIMEFNNSVDGTIFHFNHNLADESNIDKNIEVTLYRILQEALNNVIKYANANEVNVQLRDYNDILMLTVEDDGSGFDVEEAKSSDIGFGLRSMQNRIDAISGVLEIESAPGKGTFIVVQISKDILTEV